MALPSADLVSLFQASMEGNRLGHTYLITGDDPTATASLGEELSAKLLGTSPEKVRQHPDFHRVAPEGKMRAITIEPIRALERSLYLKPFKAPHKAALIVDADRMCMGQANAANAFLKTLEEPPASTIIFLATTRPQLLLPTIISRCLRLDLMASGPQKVVPELAELIADWFAQRKKGAGRAYTRAALLHAFWNAQRSTIEARVKKDAAAQTEEAEDDYIKAIVEGEFRFLRAETIAAIQREYWSRARGEQRFMEAARPCILALEELQQILNTNVNVSLAVERACLAAESIV